MENAKTATAENSTAQKCFIDQMNRKIAQNTCKNIKRLKRDNCIKNVE
jgi:hypothetical protein